MSDVCPLCKVGERRHEPTCPEGVPNRVGYWRGVPVVADLEYAADGLEIIRSNPEDGPNRWRATPWAVEKLRSTFQLKDEP